MSGIVIAGGGLAGSRTAERLRRAGYDGEVTIVGAESHAAYDRPPLSKKLLIQDEDPAAPPYVRPPENVTTLTGVAAVGLDTTTHELTLSDGALLRYDRLVIATGVRPRNLFPGTQLLRTWTDALALRSSLRDAKRVVIIGGGVLGCEVAASARQLDRDVTLVELLPQPLLPALGATIGAVVADLHHARGVDVRCSTQVDRIAKNQVVLTDGTVLEADLIVVAAGSVPNTEWLAGSNVAVADGVLCDHTGKTSAPDVYAAGDVARFPHPWQPGATVRLEHWTSAGDTAALVARNLLTAEPTGPTTTPYFWTDQYQSKIQVIGLPAPDDELTVLEGSLESKFAAHYTRDGLLTAAITVGMPAALAPYRKIIGTHLAGSQH